MKKRFIGVLMIALMVGVAGCGAKNTGDQQNVEVSEQQVVDGVEDSSEVVDEDDDSNEDSNLNEYNADLEEEQKDLEESAVEAVTYTAEELDAMNSVEFAKILGAGWNLGNTLDAEGSGLEAETCWGMPKTTPEMIHYVKEVGFTTIRIPVSWGKHTDADYQIDEEWMARVKEVVDYAYNEGLFVIINSHHDVDYYYPTAEHHDESVRYLSTIWEQIAEEFKDYDDHLIFESMNEPRLKGTDIEWWFAASDPKGRAAIEEICKLNQVFVDTVRAGEGNNSNRFIMVPSYAASQDFALNSAFSMPQDPSNKVMLSVHAYTPYAFAGEAGGYSEWDGSKNTEFIFMGKLMSNFIINGYGVVIGEFGATNKNNDESRGKWARGYTQKAAGYGIPCIVWDNMQVGVGEENFGLIDRNNLKLYFPELVESYLGAYK